MHIRCNLPYECLAFWKILGLSYTYSSRTAAFFSSQSVCPSYRAQLESRDTTHIEGRYTWASIMHAQDVSNNFASQFGPTLVLRGRPPVLGLTVPKSHFWTSLRFLTLPRIYHVQSNSAHSHFLAVFAPLLEAFCSLCSQLHSFTPYTTIKRSTSRHILPLNYSLVGCWPQKSPFQSLKASRVCGKGCKLWHEPSMQCNGSHTIRLTHKEKDKPRGKPS